MPPASQLGATVSINQAALLLNLSRRSIYNRIRDGRLRTMTTVGGSQRVLVESLRECGFIPRPQPASAAALLALRPPRPHSFGVFPWRLTTP
jgi:hypothetical protein